MAEKTGKVILSSGELYEIELNDKQLEEYEKINRKYEEAVGKKLDATMKKYFAGLRKLRRDGFVINT